MMKSITTRLIILLTACAALIVGGGMWLDYSLSRQELLQRLTHESNDEVQIVVSDLENWLNGVEGATRFLGTILAQQEYSQEGLQQMLREIVANNNEIFGAAIALNPEHLEENRGFAPYYFRRDGLIQFVDLATNNADYNLQDWFAQAVSRGTALWVEPYFDSGGAEVNMTTFSVPVYRTGDDGLRTLYAVVTADVRLKDLQQVLKQLRQGENSYSLLFSREGILMSARSQNAVMKHYSQLTNKGVGVEKWRSMFQRALAGNLISDEIPCPETDSHCTIRMGSLQTTGWPIAVVYDQREVLAPLHKYQLKTGLISTATLILMALAVYFVTSRQTLPLRILTRATESISRGIMDSPLPSARGDDEIARLVRSFSSMNRDLKTYIADLEAATASRSRIEGELAAAQDIQMSMLPGSGQAHVLESGVELWARVLPAKTVGGDLYTFFRGDNELFVAVGDVSDKGVPAALFMARAISLIQQLAGTGTPPDQAMVELNNALERDNHNCMFVTLFLGVLDIPTGELRFASAGHTEPSLLRDDAVTIVGQETGPALGLVPDQAYPTNTLSLLPGDRLAIYTDGIDEAFNETADMFGVERFNRNLLNSAREPVAEAGAYLFDSVKQYAGKQAQSDDITLLLLQYSACTGTSEQCDFDLGPGLSSRVHNWMEPILTQRDVSMDIALEVGLIAEEIVTNIQKYAGLAETETVQLTLSCDGGLLVMEVCDGGTAFDPLSQAQRSPLGAEIDSAEIGGLGVHLVTRLSDRQSYQRDGNFNILRIEKDIPAQKP